MGNQKALHDGKSVVADKEWLAQRDGGAFSAPSNSLDAYKIAVQHHIDSVAQSMGYDNAANLASYVNSTVPGWGAEAQRFVAWRDQVWTSTLAMFAEFKDGEPVLKTIEELVSELPDASLLEGRS
ncbi:hypothetical protein F9K96_05605 [Brucella anthropi]|uniref:hypothetical protein n=1 Tax=Brucella anthropi TaxID=529 RepID=UPI00124C192C|nr:hypothetical protein [Brucella anthropi]KAB2792611.1 hypothetical protein F9K96_05605 [Brucella anthropi]DAE48875.1 MAG TPA: hypothetical protein [Caudoviricetes sp.]